MPIKFDGDLPPPPPGHSSEQRQAEAYMLKALNTDLGLKVAPTRVDLPDGGHVEVDGVDEESGVYVEAFAHQGPAKAGQLRKVVMDAFKLALIGRLCEHARLILLFSDTIAAAPFESQRWFAQAIRQFGIEVRVVSLPTGIAEGLRKAQERQYR